MKYLKKFFESFDENEFLSPLMISLENNTIQI